MEKSSLIIQKKHFQTPCKTSAFLFRTVGSSQLCQSELSARPNIAVVRTVSAARGCNFFAALVTPTAPCRRQKGKGAPCCVPSALAQQGGRDFKGMIAWITTLLPVALQLVPTLSGQNCPAVPTLRGQNCLSFASPCWHGLFRHPTMMQSRQFFWRPAFAPRKGKWRNPV